VFCRITSELRERLDLLAINQRRTISQLILFALEEKYLRPKPRVKLAEGNDQSKQTAEAQNQ